MSLENRGGTMVMTGASGYTLEAQYMAGPLICAWLAVKRFRGPALLLLIPYLLYRGYAGMSRWTLVLVLLALALVYAWQKRLKWPPLWAILCAVPLYLAFHAIGKNRGLVRQWWEGTPAEAAQVEPGLPALEQAKARYNSPDFANFDFLTYVVTMVPERTGTFTYGTQYLQLFTEPIPRKLWPGKPAGAPIGFFNLNAYGNFLGLTVSLVGDGWMSGGWVGLTVTMIIVGAILGCLHRWFWKHSADNMRALFYLVGLAMIIQWYRDGGISIAKFVFWNLSPLLMWLALAWLLGRRRVPGYSTLLPAGASLRIVTPDSK